MGTPLLTDLTFGQRSGRRHLAAAVLTGSQSTPHAGIVDRVTGRNDQAPSVHDVVGDRIRQAGQVYTRGRRGLVDALLDADRPRTIPSLLVDHPEMSQSSSYRNLFILEQVGVVQRISTSDGHALFELAEDLVGHHHHLICSVCGRVDDFTASPTLEASIESALSSAAQESGFRAAGHRLDLLGTCESCA